MKSKIIKQEIRMTFALKSQPKNLVKERQISFCMWEAQCFNKK